MRYQYIDILRGVMILLMILFHFNYSLIHIFNSEILNFSDFFWYFLGKSSALGFMIISGISFFLAREKYGKSVFKKYIRYAGIITLIAGVITLGTAILIPNQLILFGILHLFAISFVLLLIISKTEYYSGWIAGILILLGIFIFPINSNSELLFPIGFVSTGFYSADYYPIIPYFGYILGGFFLGKCMKRFHLFRFFSLGRNMNMFEKIGNYMGTHSLVVYLIHQPIIIFILWCIFMVVR